MGPLRRRCVSGVQRAARVVHGGGVRAGLLLVAVPLLVAGLAVACSRDEPVEAEVASARPPAPVRDHLALTARPRALFLLDAGPGGTPVEGLELLPGRSPLALGRCPAEMVDVAGRFCIDRYEAVLVDARGRRRLSPYYPPSRAQTLASRGTWRTKRLELGPSWARVMELPEPPRWQIEESFEPLATVLAGEVPSGYASGDNAELACRNAGKRLCSRDEWVQACRGQAGRKFPYGDRYFEGRCNVFRAQHPANLLHGDASIGHLDPRLNLVEAEGEPLLRRAGATPECRSEWGGDAVYDMVGNLDEWVDDPGGAFLGGFYSRGTREGCDARVSSHPRQYFDYSLGVRCCR